LTRSGDSGHALLVAWAALGAFRESRLLGMIQSTIDSLSAWDYVLACPG
jgi:hypothetical protein